MNRLTAAQLSPD